MVSDKKSSPYWAIRVSPKYHKRVATEAALAGLSIVAWVEDAIDRKLELMEHASKVEELINNKQ